MSNSFRIRTTPGVDKSINVLIDQEFEYLEILSLKILQSDIYARPCSDYGVVVGRVSVNNGFGIPNAKISIFVPLTPEDELNPIISSIYPYKNLRTLNDDGYRYNLLPYVKSYTGHVPTGTFFTREDVLTDTTLIEVYDKYYRYTTTTNDSGDFMIFGVPVGSQTIIFDIDLSDIGEFSLSPQDLIRMGVATSSQVSGTKFKSSTNLNELPQIINIKKTVQVVPLWGQPETCTLGISRTDFDLSSDSNGVKGITINPTAIFMGSIISTSDEQYVKKNGKPTLNSGSLCDLTSGPGEILAIRQTIFKDSTGKPILETVDLEQGGQVIDENGTWLLDVPMNLDYVTTNEFGEQVLSNDPKIGIPTKAKYRFKVKWNQSPSLSEPTKRGYFLVPNIREHGWISSNSNPLSDYSSLPESNYQRAIKSYSFSLDWNDYGSVLDSNGNIDTIGVQMIQDAIDCTDTFYLMQYNKVYTVSQMIDQYRNGFLPSRFTGIKNILNSECSSDTNKFPTNDTVFGFDLIFFLFYIALFLFRPILITLVPVVHILAFALFLIGLVLSIVVIILTFFVLVVLVIIQFILYGLCAVSLGSYCKSVDFQGTINGAKDIVDFLLNVWKKLLNIKIPNISYPECNLCDCGEAGNLTNLPSSNDSGVDTSTAQNTIAESGGNSLLSQFELSVFYKIHKKYPNGALNPNYSDDSHYESIMGGYGLGSDLNDNLTQISRVPQITPYLPPPNETNSNDTHYFTDSLPLHERLNLFNNKSKYFNHDIVTNPGGGVNRIKVSFANDLPTNNGKFHYDNVIAIVCQPNAASILTPGSLISFQDLGLSKDINVKGTVGLNNQFGTNSITGTPINTYLNFLPIPITADTSTLSTSLPTYTTNLYNQITPANISLDYADFNNPGVNITTSYDIIQGLGVKVKKLPKKPNTPPQSEISIVYTGTCNYAKFPMDVEYFQVITAMTYSNYSGLCNTSLTTPSFSNMSLFNRFLNNDMMFYRTAHNNSWGQEYWFLDLNTLIKPINYFNNVEKQIVAFLVRGVDPNSERVSCTYDLSMLFGYDFPTNAQTNNNFLVSGKYKLNQPIKGGYTNVRHTITTNDTIDVISNERLFHNSFSFSASTSGLKFNFSGFNSNLVSQYSHLDSSNLSFKPGNDLNTFNPQLSPWVGTTGNVLRNKNGVFNQTPIISYYAYNGNGNTSGYNGFTTQWDYVGSDHGGSIDYRYYGVVIPSYPGNNNSTTSLNPISTPVRGYFDNEIIEGGSFMFQYIQFWYYLAAQNKSLQDNIQAIYYSPRYSTGTTINFSDSTKIVMRSDRLPTSSVLQDNINNSFLLHSNSNFAIFKLSDNGTSTPANGTSGGYGLSNGTATQDYMSGATNPIPKSINTAVESFSCGNMAPLGCYYINPNGEFGVQPKSDGCWIAPGGKQDFDGGCYVLITTIFASMLRDIELIVEWAARIQIIFGACRNVFSHSFTNNWINGSLYAFAFKNYVTYDKNNKPQHTFCSDIVVLHPTTNNFFYRSSPYDDINSEFPGANYYHSNGNSNNLLFPTTLLDMGPRNNYMQELVMSDQYDGYVMNKMGTTTYGDVTELLNLFIISRLVTTSFLQELTGIQGASIFSYFSNANLFGDGDYSQSISINSELGVAPFEASNYLDLDPVTTGTTLTTGIGTYNPQDPIYIQPNADSQAIVFGVFYDSDTQLRDFITPKRTIINSSVIVGNTNCAFNNFTVFNQVVPFYQWSIEPAVSIFGGQQNGWNTGGSPFFSHKYQELDRLNPTSEYFRTTDVSHTSNFKGYIYSVKETTLNIITPTGSFVPNYGFSENNPAYGSWSQNSSGNGAVTSGAPFHFYFGLKIGKSAFDRFATKWLDTETTIY